MKRLSPLCCAALLAAMVCAAQEPIPPVKPIPPTKPIPPVKPIPEMLPIPEIKPIPPTEGSNVKRDADTNPKRPSKTPQDCRSSASQIRSDYHNAKSEDAKRQLRRELSDLAQRCGWGALGGGPLPADSKGNGANPGASPGASPANDGGGAGGSGGAGGDGNDGGGANSSPPHIPPVGGGSAGILIIAHPNHSKPPSGFPKGLPTLLVRDRTARMQLTNAWQHVGAARTDVQPGQDIHEAAQTTAPTVPQIPNASGLARDGLISVARMESEAAALDAYAVSVARFRAARQQGDQTAMATQASLMLKFIDAASEAAHAAARSRAAADKRLLAELERRQAGARQAGGWTKALPGLGVTSESDLAPDVLSEMKSSGAQTQAISELLRDMNALQPGDIDAGIAALRAQVAADDARPNGPTPPDAASLEQERQHAQALASVPGSAARPR